ncbi:MAG: metalloprotease TldD [Deltaproteobacteria bacterium]|nr:metalloprotease TldD [Deltaproteobacteria bacterium]
MSAAQRELPVRLFRERFGIDENALDAALGVALEKQLDYADLFFESSARETLLIEDGLVRVSERHSGQGVGVRAICGERQGYAHTDEISAPSLRLAAQEARAIAEAGGQRKLPARSQSPARPSLYPTATAPTDEPLDAKIALLNEVDRYARARDPRIRQVVARLSCEQRLLMMAASDGGWAADTRPLVRLDCQVIAEAPGGRREMAFQGMGGRFELGGLLDAQKWRPMVDEAVRVALLNLEAAPCPAGTMSVVLAPGFPGILLHEAVGHGLEGDFNRKGSSAFAGRIGERVAAPGVTVVDDGTLPGRRGSLNVDDEGTPTRRTVLIEDGVLTGYLQDRLNARLMGQRPTGNGRRESYAHLPLPRMTNTFMLAGPDAPEDIIRSVQRGLYAAFFSGGQVDITNGKFVFHCIEAYRIEDGRIGQPVRGATLIGNGPDVLRRVSRIGCDLALDAGLGTCGKEGQSVPVGVGLPTLRVDELTVGGAAL